MIASLLGIVETNSYLAYQYFKIGSENLNHIDFTEMLAKEMIFKPKYIESSSQENLVLSCEHHLVPLISIDDRKRIRVQRKCIVCSKVYNIRRKGSHFCEPCGNTEFFVAQLQNVHVLHIISKMVYLKK